jgi:ribosomal protein S18 acetylase RimI-like enzyme
VNAAEIPQLTELLLTSFYPKNAWNCWIYPLMRLGIQEDLKVRLTAPVDRYCCLTVVDTQPAAARETGLLGTVELSVRSPQGWCRPRAPYLANLAVHPDYRRQGLAQQLLTACETIACSWGRPRLYLHVAGDNFQALKLYRKLGYAQAEPQADWWPQAVQRILMVKQLSP